MRATAVLGRVGLVVLGLALGFLVFEVVLRSIDAPVEVFNPLHGFHDGDARLGWRGKPDVRRRFHKDEFDVVVEHDASGFRRPEPPPPEAPRERVLFLGDSFAWGWGVPQGHVFTDRLQEKLRPGVAVYNRGVNAFGTAQEYLLLQDELARQRFARVAVLFFSNDLEDNVDRKEHRPGFALEGEQLVPRNQPAPAELQDGLSEFVDEHSRAALFLGYQAALLKSRWKGGARPDPATAAPPGGGAAVDPRTLPGYAVTDRLLGEMARTCRQHGAQLYLVYIPTQDETRIDRDAGAHDRAVHQAAREIGERHGIPVVDLTPGFREATRRGARLTFPSDGHWTSHGHFLAAELLLASALFDGWRGVAPGAPAGSAGASASGVPAARAASTASAASPPVDARAGEPPDQGAPQVPVPSRSTGILR